MASVTEVNTADEQANGRAQQWHGVVDTNHGAMLAQVVDVLQWRRHTRGTHSEGGRSDGGHCSTLCHMSAVCAVGMRHVYPGGLYDPHDNQYGGTLCELDTSVQAHCEPVCMQRECGHINMDTRYMS